MPTRADRFAFPLLLLGNVALALGPWLVRLSDTGAVATGFWRLMIALPLLWLIARKAGQPARWPGKALGWTLLIAAVFYALDLASWNIGIRMTKLGNATLFGNAGSFVFAIYGLILARVAPSLRQGGAILLALVGSALLMGSSYELSPEHFAGDLWALAAGLLYGGYLIFVDKARVHMAPMPVLLFATIMAILPLLFIALALGEKMWPDDWTPLIVFALTSQVIGQGLLVWSIGRLPPLVVGLALLTQPITSALIGWLAFSETLGAADLVGAAFVAVALVLVRLPPRGLRTAPARAS